MNAIIMLKSYEKTGAKKWYLIFGLTELVATMVVVGLHKWRHNTLLSI